MLAQLYGYDTVKSILFYRSCSFCGDVFKNAPTLFIVIRASILCYLVGWIEQCEIQYSLSGVQCSSEDDKRQKS